MAAGTSAKPSFSIAALPAIVIVAAYHRRRNASFSMNAVALGFVVPALSVLAWQFIRTYSSNDPLIHSDTLIYRDSIVFAPLAVMKLYASDLFAKFLASTLLPLSVFVMYPRRAWADEGVRFSLLAFIFGSMYTYVLAEQVRLSAGNFLWSAYVTLFVLNYFVVVFLVGEMAGAVRGRHHLIRVFPPLAALFWQLVSGIETYLWALRSH